MLRFARANQYWWRKPLVLLDGRPVPAELAVLAHELEKSEKGVWLNSPIKASGIADLELVPSKRTYQTLRKPLPLFVAAALDRVNQQARLERHCPYLVIWRTDRESFRIVEVRRADAPRRSKNRAPFLEVARSVGIPTSTAEWEFADAHGSA